MARTDKELTKTAKVQGLSISEEVQAGTYRISLNGPYEARFHRQPTNRPHRHNYYEFCLVRRGTGLFAHQGERYSLRSGDLFIALPGVGHEISSLKTRDLEVDFASFALAPGQPGQPGQAQMIIEAFLARPLVHRRHCEILAHTIKAIRELRAHDMGGYFTGELFKQLILQTMHMLTDHAPLSPSGDPVVRHHPGTLQKALLWIDARLDRPLSVEEIAKHCGLSGRHLRRIFDDALGHGVNEEIQHRRCQKARMLLTMGDFNVEQVGRQVGIESAAQFSRWFRKWTGQAPRQFRTTSPAILRPPGMSSAFHTEFIRKT
ncbi:MAG: AraC family transcriptional regulator [Verrucomicrobiota bacterium]|nr:AraC family transcriptional regulator [Verrucomicrobiota bacterium]